MLIILFNAFVSTLLIVQVLNKGSKSSTVRTTSLLAFAFKVDMKIIGCVLLSIMIRVSMQTVNFFTSTNYLFLGGSVPQ